MTREASTMFRFDTVVMRADETWTVSRTSDVPWFQPRVLLFEDVPLADLAKLEVCSIRFGLHEYLTHDPEQPPSAELLHGRPLEFPEVLAFETVAVTMRSRSGADLRVRVAFEGTGEAGAVSFDSPREHVYESDLVHMAAPNPLTGRTGTFRTPTEALVTLCRDRWIVRPRRTLDRKLVTCQPCRHELDAREPREPDEPTREVSPPTYPRSSS